MHAAPSSAPSIAARPATLQGRFPLMALRQSEHLRQCPALPQPWAPAQGPRRAAASAQIGGCAGASAAGGTPSKTEGLALSRDACCRTRSAGLFCAVMPVNIFIYIYNTQKRKRQPAEPVYAAQDQGQAGAFVRRASACLAWSAGEAPG